MKLGSETQIMGAASDIGAGHEGSAFIISSTSALFVGSKVQKLTKANAFVDMAYAPPNPRRVDVDQYGQALISDIYGQIWSQDGLYFALQEGYAIDIGASDNKAIWALNQYGEPKNIEVQERIYLSGAE